MRRFAFSLLFAALWAASPARAYSPEGFPGSTWGNAARDLDAIEGNSTMGKVTQGVKWLTLPGGVGLETYGSYRWRWRTENQRFFDAYGPAAGVGLSKWFFTAGADFAWIRFPQLDENPRNFQFYGSWYKRYNWAKPLGIASLLGVPIEGLPAGSWGSVSHDLDNLEGDGTMGWVSQGIDWVRLPYRFTLSTFGAFRWRARTKNKRFFNTHGPAVGVELRGNPISASLEYNWKYFPELGRRTNDLRAELTWYHSWDLKKRKR